MARSIVVLLALSAVIPFAVAQQQKNNYIWGKKGATDVVIAMETVTVPFSLGRIVTRDYSYTQTGEKPVTITAVEVTDNKNRKGATAELVSGGPGATAVAIKFTSRRGFGIRDTVTLYGAAT